MSEEIRPFEEYKEIIKDMRKEEMIRGLYDLSARVTKQENIIKEVRELCSKQLISNTNITGYSDEMCLKDILEIIDREEK